MKGVDNLTSVDDCEFLLQIIQSCDSLWKELFELIYSLHVRLDPLISFAIYHSHCGYLC